AQLRQQLIRIGGLLQQAEVTQLETLSRQRAQGDADVTADQGMAALEQEIVEVVESLRELTGRRQETELRTALARQRSDDLVRQLERARQTLRSHGDELAHRRDAEGGLAVQRALINEEDCGGSRPPRPYAPTSRPWSRRSSRVSRPSM